MLIFGEKEIAKKKFYTSKRTIIVWAVNVDNTVISKLLETKAISKYFIGIKFDRARRRLVLLMPKTSGYVKLFKVKEDK